MGKSSSSSGGERDGGGAFASADALPSSEKGEQGTMTLDPLPPPKLPNGKPNPEFYAAQLRRLNQINENWLRDKGRPVTGFVASQKGILNAAKAAGCDESEIGDGRSIATRIDDAVERLIMGDVDAILEQQDDVLKAMVASCKSAIEKCDAKLAAVKDSQVSLAERERARKQSDRGKWVRSLIEAVMRLRAMAIHAVPPGSRLDLAPAMEASHVLRFMVYVYRSDLPGRKGMASPAERIHEIANHHAEIATRYWIARERVAYLVKGTPQEVSDRPDLFHPVGGWVRDAFECTGLLVMCPPRHGKSAIGTAITALEINKNNQIQAAMTHAVDAHAAKNMRHVSAAFKGVGHRDESAIGRRNLSLFPAKLSRRDNNEASMRLRSDNPTRDPTLFASGVMSSVGGSNLDFLWSDDDVNPEEAQRPNQREITATKWFNQWMKRLQGKNPFVLKTLTLWHDDDTNGRMVKMIGRGELNMHVLVLPAGGPRRKERFGRVIEAWQSVWPEKYPSSWLKQAFVGMTPYDYSCQFECDPISDDERVVKSLRMFVASIDENEVNVPAWVYEQVRAHQRWMLTAEFHCTIDPAATSKEQQEKQRHKADKAGMIWAGVGMLREVVLNEGGHLVHSEGRNVVRIMDCMTFLATPSDAVARFGDFFKTHKVDKVHVEVTGVGLATSELLRNNYKLPASALIEHRPGRRSKRERLRATSVMLDNSGVDLGLPPAVVEYAGVWRNGRVELVPSVREVWEQTLNFGFVTDDHCVDAQSQLLAWLSPQIHLGGAVTNIVNLSSEDQTPAERTRSRISEMLGRYANPGEENPELDDLRAMDNCAAGGVW